MPLRCLRRLFRQVEHQTGTPEELAEPMPSPSWSTAEAPRLVVHGQRARTEPLGSPNMRRPFQCSFPCLPEEANQGRVVCQFSRRSSTSEMTSDTALEEDGEESLLEEESESAGSDPAVASAEDEEEDDEEEADEESADPEDEEEEDEEEASCSTAAEESRRLCFRERSGRYGFSLPRSDEGGWVDRLPRA